MDARYTARFQDKAKELTAQLYKLSLDSSTKLAIKTITDDPSDPDSGKIAVTCARPQDIIQITCTYANPVPALTQEN